MFNIGGPELILILIIALVVVGPKQLPQMGRTIGTAVKEFKKAASEIQKEIKVENDEKSK